MSNYYLRELKIKQPEMTGRPELNRVVILFSELKAEEDI